MLFGAYPNDLILITSLKTLSPNIVLFWDTGVWDFNRWILRGHSSAHNKCRVLCSGKVTSPDEIICCPWPPESEKREWQRERQYYFWSVSPFLLPAPPQFECSSLTNTTHQGYHVCIGNGAPSSKLSAGWGACTKLVFKRNGIGEKKCSMSPTQPSALCREVQTFSGRW